MKKASNAVMNPMRAQTGSVTFERDIKSGRE